MNLCAKLMKGISGSSIELDERRVADKAGVTMIERGSRESLVEEPAQRQRSVRMEIHLKRTVESMHQIQAGTQD